MDKQKNPSDSKTMLELRSTEQLILLQGGYNMDKQVVQKKFVEFTDGLTTITQNEWLNNRDEIARETQAFLVEDIEGTIGHLLRLYEADFNNSRQMVADLVSAIREINTFDFVVDESGFSEIFRANEALNDVFVVGSTEDDYEFCDENFGEDFV